MAGIANSIVISLLILLNRIECQNKVYYIATSAGDSVLGNEKRILEKSILSNQQSFTLILEFEIYIFNQVK